MSKREQAARRRLDQACETCGYHGVVSDYTRPREAHRLVLEVARSYPQETSQFAALNKLAAAALNYANVQERERAESARRQAAQVTSQKTYAEGRADMLADVEAWLLSPDAMAVLIAQDGDMTGIRALVTYLRDRVRRGGTPSTRKTPAEWLAPAVLCESCFRSVAP